MQYPPLRILEDKKDLRQRIIKRRVISGNIKGARKIAKKQRSYKKDMIKAHQQAYQNCINKAKQNISQNYIKNRKLITTYLIEAQTHLIETKRYSSKEDKKQIDINSQILDYAIASNKKLKKAAVTFWLDTAQNSTPHLQYSHPTKYNKQITTNHKQHTKNHKPRTINQYYKPLLKTAMEVALALI